MPKILEKISFLNLKDAFKCVSYRYTEFFKSIQTTALTVHVVVHFAFIIVYIFRSDFILYLLLKEKKTHGNFSKCGKRFQFAQSSIHTAML